MKHPLSLAGARLISGNQDSSLSQIQWWSECLGLLLKATVGPTIRERLGCSSPLAPPPELLWAARAPSVVSRAALNRVCQLGETPGDSPARKGVQSCPELMGAECWEC